MMNSASRELKFRFSTFVRHCFSHQVCAALLRDYLQRHPGERKIEWALARSLSALKEHAEAERLLRDAADLRAPATELAIQTGVLACRRARWRDALGPLRTGTAADPLSVTGRYFLGEALNQTDDLRGALEAYEAALAIDPSHWRALKGMGKVLDRLGRSTEAAVYHRRAREAQAR